MAASTMNQVDADTGEQWRIHGPHTDGSVAARIEQLRLKPGLELTAMDKSGRILGHKAQFVAVFAGKGVLVSLLADHSENIEMHAGEEYYVSGFTGKFSFTFTASAISVNHRQFTAMISVPASVAAHFVRKNMGAEITLPATVLPTGSTAPVPVTISNLSVGGAGLDSNTVIGVTGDIITLSFQATFERRKSVLELAAVIRHMAGSADGDKLRTGVDFVNPSQNDKLLLHYHINSLADRA